MRQLGKIKVSSIYAVMIVFVTTIMLISYYSYAMFTTTNEKKNAINIVTGNLLYHMNCDGVMNNQIDLPANSTKVVEVTVESLNSVESAYQLYYENNSNVSVKYAENTDNPMQEQIGPQPGGDFFKTTKLVITNLSDDEQEVIIGVQGGLVGRNLVLANGRTAINEIAKYSVATRTVTGGIITVDSIASYDTSVTIDTNSTDNFEYYGATIRDGDGNVLQTLDEDTTTFSMPAQDVVVSPKWKYTDLGIFSIVNTIPVSDNWTIGKHNNNNIDIEFFDYHIGYNSSTEDFNVAEIWSVQTYDLTQYDYLEIIGYGEAQSGYYLMAGVTENISTNTWLWEGMSQQEFIPYDTHIAVILDISNLTGNYYLGIGIQTNNEKFEGFVSQVRLFGKIYE